MSSTAAARVVYQPDSQSKNKYSVMVNPEKFEEWQKNETTSVTEVIDGQENVRQKGSGLWLTPSQQELHSAFGTTENEEIIKKILKNGKMKGLGHPTNKNSTIKNAARGSSVLDTRGNNPTGI